MSVIEGIGDEVLICGVVLVASILLVLAWNSTSVGDSHILGRVSIIIERNLGNATVPSGSGEERDVRSEEGDRTSEEVPTQAPVTVEDSSSVVVEDPTTPNELRETRLKHFTSSLNEERTEDAGNSAESENAVEGENNVDAESIEEIPVDRTEVTEEEEGLESITIKLKYLNDTQRLVDGRLEEKLGEFKQRHFAVELGGNKLVKLIFNGKLLHSDTDTLRSCGIFDQCVIHCYVAPPPARESVPDAAQHELDLDLGHLMLPLFCILLAILWFCWFEFGQLFNATATTALVSLTGLLGISLLALYPADRLLDMNFIRRN